MYDTGNHPLKSHRACFDTYSETFTFIGILHFTYRYCLIDFTLALFYFVQFQRINMALLRTFVLVFFRAQKKTERCSIFMIHFLNRAVQVCIPHSCRNQENHEQHLTTVARPPQRGFARATFRTAHAAPLFMEGLQTD